MLGNFFTEAFSLNALEGGGRFESLLFSKHGRAVTRVASAATPICNGLKEPEISLGTEILRDMPLLERRDTRFLQLRRGFFL